MAPSATWVVSAGIVSIALALAVLFALGHTFALRRLGFVHSVVVRRTWIAGVGAAIWMAAFFGVASTGLLARFELRPPPLIFALVAMVTGAVVFASSRAGATVAQGLPIAALIGAQAFRLPLELVMHEAARAGTMPVQMSFSGWNFDIVTGITACVVAPLAATGRASRGLLVAWNVLGSSLLLVIVAIAVASTPVFHAFGTGPALNIWIAYAPFIWLPSVMVTFAIASHILIFRQLFRRTVGDIATRQTTSLS